MTHSLHILTRREIGNAQIFACPFAKNVLVSVEAVPIAEWTDRKSEDRAPKKMPTACVQAGAKGDQRSMVRRRAPLSWRSVAYYYSGVLTDYRFGVAMLPLPAN
jgi:hypothetical protein